MAGQIFAQLFAVATIWLKSKKGRKGCCLGVRAGRRYRSKYVVLGLLLSLPTVAPHASQWDQKGDQEIRLSSEQDPSTCQSFDLYTFQVTFAGAIRDLVAVWFT